MGFSLKTVKFWFSGKLTKNVKNCGTFFKIVFQTKRHKIKIWRHFLFFIKNMLHEDRGPILQTRDLYYMRPHIRLDQTSIQDEGLTISRTSIQLPRAGPHHSEEQRDYTNPGTGKVQSPIFFKIYYSNIVEKNLRFSMNCFFNKN